MDVDDVLGDMINDADDDDGDAPSPQLHVCDYVGEDGICGSSFDTKQKLNAHRLGKHRLKSDGTAASPNRGAGVPKSKTATKTRAKSATRKAADKAAAPVTNRADTYASSIATVALLTHLAAGRYFDNYDLDVVSRGAVPLGAALDQVGEQNETMRRICDAVLAGGTGGAYVQLILAATMIAVPIAAHHGVLPQATGERFADMLGAMAPPPPGVSADSPDSTVAPTQQSPTGEPPTPSFLGGKPPSEWTFDEWGLAMATQMPPDMQRQAMGGGAITTTIPTMPGTEPMHIEEEHRGAAGTDQGTATQSVPA